MKTHRILLSLTLLSSLLVAFVLPGCDKLITEVNNITVIDTTLGKECQNCHTDRNDKLIVIPQAQWANSAHSSPGLLEYPVLLNGQLKTATACGPSCHSGNGYVDSVLNGHPSDTTRPSTINCYTCHLPHSVANQVSLIDSLRGIALAVTLADGESKYIHGKSNMCANCHRATGAPPTSTTTDVTLAANFGPHYSAQADVFNGTAGFRFDTTTVLANSHQPPLLNNGCITCHFGKGEGYDLGEHTFRLQYHDAVHDTTPYVANCSVAGCHTASAVSNFYAVSGNNQSESRGDSIKMYGDSLRGLLAGSFILDSADTAGTMYKVGDILPPIAANVLYNYLLYRHDGSRGLHNPQLVNDLLKHSVQYWDSIPPRADFTISDNDVCVGDPVTFTNRTRYNFHRSEWKLVDSVNITSTENSPTYSYASPGVYKVTLKVINDSLNTSALATKSPGVTVHGPITARIHVADSIVCQSAGVTLVDSSSGIPTSRQWYFPPNTDSIYTGQTVTYRPTKTGADSFTVVLRSFNSCTPGGDTTVRVVQFEADAAPIANFVYAPTNVVINQPVQFTDSSSGPAREWRWIFDSAGTVKDTVYEQSPIYTFTTTGPHSVVLKVKNDCDSSTQSVTITVGTVGISPAEIRPRPEVRK